MAAAKLVDKRELQTAIRALNNTILHGQVMLVREDRRNLSRGNGESQSYAPRSGGDSLCEPAGQLGCLERDRGLQRADNYRIRGDSIEGDLSNGGHGDGFRGDCSREVSDCGRVQDMPGWVRRGRRCDPSAMRSRSPLRRNRSGCLAVEDGDSRCGGSGKGRFCQPGLRKFRIPARPLLSQPLQQLDTPAARRLFAENLAVGVGSQAP